MNPRRIFSQEREPAQATDEQLSATQKSGVIPQRLYMEQEDQKVVLALAGLDNFKRVRAGDFVISLRSFQGGIERSSYDGCVSPAYTVLRPKLKTDGGYFRYLLKTDEFILKLQSVTSGIRDGRNVSYEQFALVPLCFPPLPEQTAIAAFLDRETAKIDALVEEQRRLIDLLREKRQAVISHAVTRGLNPAAKLKPSGVDWLGDVPEWWEVASVRRCSTRVVTGSTPSNDAPNTEQDEAFAWYTPGDFSEELLLSASARSVPSSTVLAGELRVFPSNSVLVVSIGATLGKVGYSEVACSANQQINAIVPNEKVTARFLAYSLSEKTAVMRFLSNASTIGIMNQEKTKEIVIAVPPIREQDDIVRYLDQRTSELKALSETAEVAITLLQERRAALISAAVTGKIDVRDFAAETEAA
ncbi:restriction endonuclease subunit S [Gemmobacter straminiformis]|uniref:Restriction endonuclease subunit S n=2 Tax=Paragemmobacter straminiformis TaxID=2045119 RepID=A0A842I3R2_9RHOB|nr:restriction endonuclease subunit S [Gemmobacter straminiformis]